MHGRLHRVEVTLILPRTPVLGVKNLHGNLLVVALGPPDAAVVALTNQLQEFKRLVLVAQPVLEAYLEVLASSRSRFEVVVCIKCDTSTDKDYDNNKNSSNYCYGDG